ncbi:MAG: rhodanese-like domain-containing protein [Pseudomonadota bacterium]
MSEQHILTENVQASQQPQADLEIGLSTALELVRLNLGVFIDVRQAFETELEGAIPGAVLLPLFHVKKLLGHRLNEEEQEILDSDVPDEVDVQTFFMRVNQLHYARSQLLFCLCNSGRRSLHAARLLRELGYDKAYSVRGGFREYRNSLSVGSGGGE